MGLPLSSLVGPRRGPSLTALERLAPPPPDDLVAAEIEARTVSGDIVLDVHGRGGWVARAAVDRLRRGWTLESTALTALVAELVLRPPDLRHVDATITALANTARGGTSLRQSIAQGFLSTCPDCGGAVRVEEYIWEGDAGAPARRQFRCGHCRSAKADGRPLLVDEEDIARARSFASSAARGHLLARFPVPEDGHPLPGDLLGLYTPRVLDGMAAILDRIEGDLRAPSVQAALRLAFVHLVLPASRLNAYGGRTGTLRVASGRLKPPGARQVRERDPWLLFEEGCRAVRAFVQRIEGSATGRLQARYGRDLGALLDGSANVVLRHGSVVDPRNGGRLAGTGGTLDERSVRLVVTQLPIHWSPENLAFAYLATSLALGYDAAATLPLEALFSGGPRGEWAWDAAALRRSLGAAAEVLAPDGEVLVLLDRTGPGGLVAGVLGGVGAGYRLTDALLAEAGDDIAGVLEFRPAGTAIDGERAFPELPAADPSAQFSLRAVERAVSDIAVAVLQARGEPARSERLLGEVLIGLDRLGHLARLVGRRPAAGSPTRVPAGPVPAGLFGEVPPPVDGDGATASAGTAAGAAPAADGAEPGTAAAGTAAAGTAADGAAAEAAAAPAGAADAAPAPSRSWRDPGRGARDPGRGARDPGPWASADGRPEGRGAAPWPTPGDEPFAGVLPEAVAPSARVTDGPLEVAESPPPSAARSPAAAMAASERIVAWGDETAGVDPVRLTLDIVMGELRRPDHPRLVELEPGRWWLRSADDAGAARTPLSDRVEWAVFSLLSTSGGIGEAAFGDRIMAMFRGCDTPDEEIVRECLDSYRVPDPAPGALLRTEDVLQARYEEHGTLVGRIAEFGHRLGLRCWISRREQRRRYRGAPLANLLSEAEQHASLPLIHPGPADALESVDCIWYLRGKATFLFEVEWTAMLDEAVVRRGGRIPTTDTLVRFLVIPPERTELVRLKLSRSPVLRARFEEDNWHVVKSDHLVRLLARADASLDDLGPLLGLDPAIERAGSQLALFG